jgi:hypothetical protein
VVRRSSYAVTTKFPSELFRAWVVKSGSASQSPSIWSKNNWSRSLRSSPNRSFSSSIIWERASGSCSCCLPRPSPKMDVTSPCSPSSDSDPSKVISLRRWESSTADPRSPYIFDGGNAQGPTYGKAVDYDSRNDAQLLPGDPVFSSDNGTVAGIGHVAIYFGDGQVVQAPDSGSYIEITPLNQVESGYYGATRQLN